MLWLVTYCNYQRVRYRSLVTNYLLLKIFFPWALPYFCGFDCFVGCAHEAFYIAVCSWPFGDYNSLRPCYMSQLPMPIFRATMLRVVLQAFETNSKTRNMLREPTVAQKIVPGDLLQVDSCNTALMRRSTSKLMYSCKDMLIT